MGGLLSTPNTNLQANQVLSSNLNGRTLVNTKHQFASKSSIVKQLEWEDSCQHPIACKFVDKEKSEDSSN